MAATSSTIARSMPDVGCDGLIGQAPGGLGSRAPSFRTPPGCGLLGFRRGELPAGCTPDAARPLAVGAVGRRRSTCDAPRGASSGHKSRARASSTSTWMTACARVMSLDRRGSADVGHHLAVVTLHSRASAGPYPVAVGGVREKAAGPGDPSRLALQPFARLGL
jgi:hypothetical protein